MWQAGIEILEFEKVRRLLAAYAVTAGGKRKAGELAPQDDLWSVDQSLAATSEMRAALEAEAVYLPLGDIRDVWEPVRRAGAGGGPLRAEALWAVGKTVQSACQIGRNLGRLGAEYPTLRRMGGRMPRLGALAEEVLRSIDASGIIRDESSGELAKLRRAQGKLRKRIHDELQGLMNAPGVRGHLQYPNYTIVRDRYVLPLHAGARGAVAGIVHGSSDSGQTVYVEPQRIVGLGNQLCEVEGAIEEEEKRIRWELTHRVGREHEEILLSLELSAWADLVHAKARMSRDYGMCAPTMTEELVLELQEARHPLLMYLHTERAEAAEGPEAGPVALAGVVPMDIHLGDDFRVIVITGPNTGGKTVALKTVGLLCLMARAGMHVPARRARIPFYDAVFADIGDEQSLEQNLSTFSSHLRHIIQFLGGATERSLVLLDELGAGTDPIEGAALGRVVVEALAGRGVSAVVTTHLGALKSLAFQMPEVENACVEFDSATLKPTYRLSIGTPGASNALEIASHLGFPDKLLRDAQGYSREMRGEAQESLLAVVQEVRRDAEERRQRAQELEAEAEELKAHYEELLGRLREEETRKDLGWAVEVKEKVSALSRRARGLYDDFRFSHRRQARTLKALSEELAELEERLAGVVGGHAPERKLSEGDEIYVPRLHRWGHVVRVDKRHGTVVVSYGQGTAELPSEDVLLWEEVGGAGKGG
jgi:DNA mismatch repair protein MutS2